MRSYPAKPSIYCSAALQTAAFATGCIALGLAFADSSWAQGAPPPSSTPENASPIETVTVVAEKRGVAENAQDVPIALTAVNGVELDERHVRTLQDLTIASPNVTLADAGTVPGFANFTIRGLGTSTTIPSMEPAVGIFVDGIYLGVGVGAVLDIFDIEDIEILRGPQGLLFGRNTTGGAVLINTRRPGDQFMVRGRFNYETGPQETGAASIEGPLGNQVRAKVTGYYSNDDGWFKNDFDGRKFGASRSGFVRPMLVFNTPSKDFDTTLIYEHSWRRSDGAVAQNPLYNTGFHINIDNRGYDRFHWDAVTLESNWHQLNGVFTNLFGYRDLSQDAAADIDALPIPAFHAQSKFDQHQYSDELRYFGSFFDKLDVTVGLYYFKQRYFYLERRLLVGGAVDSTLGGLVDHENYAAFGTVDYRINPTWTLTAGGRFTSERKKVEVATFLPVTALSRCNFTTEICKFNFPGPAFPGVPAEKTWDFFTPKLGVQWHPDTDLLVYGQWARGERSGGYNVRDTSVNPPLPPGPYDPEKQDAFELGVKSDWLDKRLRVNAAAFYDKIKDMQRDVNTTDPVAIVVQTTRNTADATIKGFEFEVTGAPTDELLLFGNVGYLDGNYDKIFFDLDGGGIGASDLRLNIPRLSKWSYAVGAAYKRNLPGDFVLRLRADYGYRSRSASTDDNTRYFVPIEDLSANLAVTLPGDHWTISVYGRNLLDKVTEGVNAPLPDKVGPFLVGGSFRTLNEGRVVGVQASFSY